MEKRTTIYDIAERLGISTATVNRALTGKPRVKEETRALVLKTAAEAGVDRLHQLFGIPRPLPEERDGRGRGACGLQYLRGLLQL